MTEENKELTQNFDPQAVKTFTIECPACHMEMEVMVGETVCPHCQSTISLEIG